VQTFELKFSGVTILQGVEFPVFLLIRSWALQQCSATALPVISSTAALPPSDYSAFKSVRTNTVKQRYSNNTTKR